jgi:hypothetical protein
MQKVIVVIPCQNEAECLNPVAFLVFPAVFLIINLGFGGKDEKRIHVAHNNLLYTGADQCVCRNRL